MRIECHYCGTEYDPAETKNCPSCGASSGSNDQADKYREIQLEMEQLEIEHKKQQVNYQRIQNEQKNNELQFQKIRNDAAKAAKPLTTIVSAIFAIVFVIILGSFLFNFLRASVFSAAISDALTSSRPSDYSNSAVQTSSPAGTSSVVETGTADGINAPVYMSDYAIRCTYAEFANDLDTKPTKGYRYVRFHLVIECKTDKGMYPYNPVTCLADGYSCQSKYDPDHKKFITEKISKGAKTEGFYTFEIKEDAKSVSIVYNDCATIVIDNLMLGLFELEEAGVFDSSQEEQEA